MKSRQNFLSLVVGFTLLWLVLSYSLSWQVIAVGLGVALILTIVYGGARYAMLGEITPSLNVIKASMIYIFVFLKELIKSNLDVALRVINPSLPINPGIVEVKTKLKSPLGRLVLANSITLTPGTLTVEIKEDSLFIHWIDVSSPDIDAATQAIVQTFEQYLKVIYG
jgi:multicomponent Na+:H+ antiporter subunit E